MTLASRLQDTYYPENISDALNNILTSVEKSKLHKYKISIIYYKVTIYNVVCTFSTLK